jgi:3-deoxy-manno-octulosonate cytidylyltransferase (CMP-KDO synthetase)
MNDQPSIPLSTASSSYVIIPARLASTRLPQKLLLAETGQPLIQHTYQAALKARKPKGVCVAADCEQIASAVRAFGGEVVLTDPQAASGTDRVAEAARKLPRAEIIVNVQGDEPELSAEAIDQVIGMLEADPTAAMATLATPIRRREQLDDPACVKVVFGSALSGSGGDALYFSRSPIPHARTWSDELLEAQPPHFYQHIGLYAYRREFLLELSALPRSAAEILESLEQLRVLSLGYKIKVGVIEEPSIGIDTADDYRRFVSNWKRAG